MQRSPIILLLPALALSACGGNGSTPAAKATPETVQPGVVVLSISDFADTDQNRYRDSTTAVVYIHASSGAYPIPMKARGSIEFTLVKPDRRPLARWAFDEAQVAAAMRNLAPGPGFVFELNLNTVATDQLQDREAEIICTFTPRQGAPIRARPTAPLLIGSVTRQ